MLVSGCAGLPRIDPSGRRIFIWPERPAAGSSPITFGGGSAPPLGNVDAPPVYSGQTAPPPGPGTPPPAFGQPAAGGVVGSTPATGPVGGPKTERLSITPSRMLAPVGSEVILKAGVCGPKDYLRTNRRIEWMLGQEGAGQFVTVGEQGEMDILRFPWQRPNKFDNTYAVGYAAPFHVCLRRGTEDTSDDVQVRPGEAWITVSSASEGVSYVTATAPESGNWEARRANATIYWVDAQWRLPGPLSLQPGQTGTLTTTVTRKSDGAPVQGWLVRYEVAQGAGARVGYEAGSVSEATTDASGNASIAVTPTDDQPGSATVRVTVVRPPNAGQMPSPRLELGGGETVVSWTPTAAPVQPPIDGGGGIDRGDNQPPPPYRPPPSPGDDSDPLAPPPSSIGPRIELKLARDSFGQLQVGDPIPVLITLINTGDRPAENASMQIRYDVGLSSPADPLGEYVLTRDDLPVIVPGQSIEIPVDFAAAQPGRQCHRVTVTADGMQSAFDEQCFDIRAAAPAAAPRLRIETAIDAATTVGETFTLLATVYNDGTVPAENVRIEVLSDDAVEAEQASDDQQPIPRGVAWAARRIEAGGRYEVEVLFRAKQASPAARVTTYALLSDTDYIERTDPIEVRPAAAGQPGTPAGGAPAAALRATVRVPGNPARVGQAGTIELEFRNEGAEPLTNVRMRLLAPPQVRLNLTGPSMRRFTQTGDTYEFEPLQALGAGERFTLTVPYTPVEQRSFVIVLQGLANNTPVEDRVEVTVLPR